MYSLHSKIILILLLIVSFNLVIFSQAKKTDRHVKYVTNENVKLDSVDVNSYIKNMNLIMYSDKPAKIPTTVDITTANRTTPDIPTADRTAPDWKTDLDYTIFSDFEGDVVISSLDSNEDVFVKKIYFNYEIFDDSTINYHHTMKLTCFVSYNDILGYMYLPANYFVEYINPILDIYSAHNKPIYQYQEIQKETERQKQDELRVQKQKENDELRRQRQIEEEERLKEKTAKLIKKYGKKFGTLVANKKIQLGMTKEMVEDSWGKPKDINRTVGSWGVHEQWVYSNTYLYFENGKLTSWQD